MSWHGAPLRALEGGFSGETFVVGDGADRLVLRIYARDPARAAVDASLLRLMSGLVPVPAVAELRHPTATSPAVLVTEYVEGTRLDLALADERHPLDAQTLGGSIARVLDRLAGIPFLRAGTFAAADLRLTEEGLPDDLLAWARLLRARGLLASWPEPAWQALESLVDSAEDALEQESSARRATAVLTHSDFNPKNLLVDLATSEVVAVLDWEFAHAGSRFADLGNFTRFEREPCLVAAVLENLSDLPVDAREDHLLHCRATDLWAQLELAGRVEPTPVGELANQLLLAQARSGDLNAWPWPTPRVSPAG